MQQIKKTKNNIKTKIVYSMLTSILAIYSTNAQAAGSLFGYFFSNTGNTSTTNNTKKVFLEDQDDFRNDNNNNDDDSTGRVSTDIPCEHSDTDEYSKNNFYTLSTLNQIYEMLANDNALPTVSKFEYNKSLIYKITEKDSKSNTTSSFSVKVNTEKLNPIRSGKVFLTALAWFSDNIKDSDNHDNTRQIKDFLIYGLQNTNKLLGFPVLTENLDSKGLYTQYIETLRKAYVQIDGIVDEKQDAVYKLQLGFLKIMAQCIDETHVNAVTCQKTAKSLSNWLLYSKSMMFFTNAPSTDIENEIPALKKMTHLRDEIQIQRKLMKTTNTNTALRLADWTEQALYDWTLAFFDLEYRKLYNWSLTLFDLK